MKKPRKTKLARFVLRLPPALKASLWKDAERQGRSLNRHIVTVLARS